MQSTPLASRLANFGQAGTAKQEVKCAHSDIAADVQGTHVSTQNRLCAVSVQPQAIIRGMFNYKAAELTGPADNTAASQNIEQGTLQAFLMQTKLRTQSVPMTRSQF